MNQDFFHMITQGLQDTHSEKEASQLCKMGEAGIMLNDSAVQFVITTLT